MKITFFGTSHGIPEPDRFCTCILIEAAGKKYLIDGGAPAASLLIAHGMTPEDIDAVFMTHTHGDHINGLLEMIDLESWYFTAAETRFLFPEQNAVDAIRTYLRATHGNTPVKEVPMETYEPGVIWNDGTLTVTAIRNRHLPEPRRTFSFLLEAEGRRALFTGDMSPTFEDFPADVGRVDIVFCEAAHCRLEDAAPYLSKADTPRMVFYHIAPKNGDRKPQPLPFENSFAADGDVYEI